MSDFALAAGQGGLTVWPKEQQLAYGDKEHSYVHTIFADHAAYAAPLVAALQALAADARFSHQRGRHLGGTKLYWRDHRDIEAWSFLNERALAFYRALGRGKEGRIAVAWANLYRQGDYIVPHSHIEAELSLVYCLDPGERPDDPRSYSGQFCFADPRMAACCPVEAGRMTNTIGPVFQAGLMIGFPASAIHFVHPYDGVQPRITLSWNLVAAA